MTSVIKHHARTFILSVATAALLAPSVHADCTYELFNIASVKGTTIGDFIDQLSEECGMSIIIADPEAEKTLAKPMNKTFLKNLTINEVLDLIIKENNLQYTLQNNILKVSYLQTKTYNLDYIISERKGSGSTDIVLSSSNKSSKSTNQTAMVAGGAATSTTGGAMGATRQTGSQSGMKITSIDEVQFWDTLSNELENILNRPEDTYKTQTPIINKNAGMVTVTATGTQIQRLDQYLKDLQKKMQYQVLIDVQMYSVSLNNGSTTGIDWSQIYALQNIKLNFDLANQNNVSPFTPTMGTSTTSTFGTIGGIATGASTAKLFQMSGGGSLNQVINFLKTQGNVNALSNPKILTLNNQPALITVGTELFYKIQNVTTLGGVSAGTSNTVTDNVIDSVFSGILLDITPEISDDNTITLKINPSISEAGSDVVRASDGTRSVPPDLTRRQLSSVITVKDGSRVILGGLINTKMVDNGNKVPLLGDIPGIGYLFKTEGKSKLTEELVVIIEPHIIKKEGSDLSLSNLGYSRLDEEVDSVKKSAH
jgi:general secretion pathway protein D